MNCLISVLLMLAVNRLFLSAIAISFLFLNPILLSTIIHFGQDTPSLANDSTPLLVGSISSVIRAVCLYIPRFASTDSKPLLAMVAQYPATKIHTKNYIINIAIQLNRT